ncbi:flagellin lysine-N-methylase [Hyalangium sp. s54d21]|uniref:Flagellin lysine-N-methylase n=1 Tax=Hyalangium rubrum TaxID=3103134 RepID=A0ABU5H292_9BACT|nr:flagellin lysine-N-methylase [Hyalangium sp. s54d21]
MLEFQCLAERCEDTCCVGLRVPVSEERLWQLRQVVAGGPDEARVDAVVHVEPARPPSERAFIEMRSDGSCPFFDTERLCSLQRRYGEQVLSDACVSFPRVAWKTAEGVEVAGSLACPEMARLVLLKEGAPELVPGPMAQVPRPEAARPMPGTPGDAYVVHFEAIRAAALRLLHRGEFPLASRLAMLGQLAFRLDSVFRGAEPFEGDAAQAGAVLAEVLPAFEVTETLEEMHQGFSALEIPGGPCAGLLSSLLKSRMGVARGERFAPFARGVLASLAGSEDGAGEPDSMWREYVARWSRLEASHGERVAQYFLHYTVNQWLRSPFTEAPDLLAYVFRLALRVALLRLTLVGHPEVAALLASGNASEDSRAVLDRSAVECFSLVSRHVEQAPEVLALVKNLAGSGGAETLGKTLVFARFC